MKITEKAIIEGLKQEIKGSMKVWSELKEKNDINRRINL
jgi:hypothetical protein